MRNKLTALVIAVVVVVVFWGITKTFYQQDEWHGMADILASGSKSVIFGNNNVLWVLLGKGRMLGNLLVYFFYSSFPFEVFPIAVFVVALHVIGALVLFFLSYKITQNTIASTVGAMFFALNGVSHGAVTWPASATATLPASLLIFVSIILFLQFIKKPNKKYLYFSFFLLYLSIFFKETAMPFFIFLPLSTLIFKRVSFRKLISNYWIFWVFGGVAVLTRVFQFQNIQAQQDLFLTGASDNYLQTLVLRAVMYPLTSFSLMFVPSTPIFLLAKQFTWSYYPFFDPSLYDLVAQTAVLDIISVFLTLTICFLLFVIFQKDRKSMKQTVVFWILFIAFSFLPYIIVSKSYSYLESRYYYISVFGAGVLLSLTITRLKKLLPAVFYGVFLVGVFLFLLVHVGEVNKEIAKQVDLAQERKSILNTIIRVKPKLDQKSVFYLTGDRNFYVSQGNPVPMQQGMGQTLLVWYLAKRSAPEPLTRLLSDHYLWGIGEQGFKQVGDAGFGYFWEFNRLKELIDERIINKEDVVAFYYDSRLQELKNTTAQLDF